MWGILLDCSAGGEPSIAGSILDNPDRHGGAGCSPRYHPCRPHGVFRLRTGRNNPVIRQCIRSKSTQSFTRTKQVFFPQNHPVLEMQFLPAADNFRFWLCAPAIMSIPSIDRSLGKRQPLIVPDGP
jgi:hypothetical protein